jgi:hypothetical protein
LAELAAGRTVVEICGDPGMPCPGTVWQWVVADACDFAGRYRRARETGRARMGRHTLYTADLADWILDQLAGGRTLADVCRDPAMPARPTVQSWVEADREGFAARYKAARDSGCDAMADQIIDIADDASGDWIVLAKPDGTTEIVANPQHLQRCKLRISARRWRLSKLLPGVYGDRPDPAAQEKPVSDLAILLKEIDGTTRGLPSEDIAWDPEKSALKGKLW